MPRFRQQPVDLVLDVRSKLEFWLGHLPGAEHMPVDRVVEDLPSRTDVPKTARILVYCASGARSAAATEALRRLGYTRVVDGGGMASAAAAYDAG